MTSRCRRSSAKFLLTLTQRLSYLTTSSRFVSRTVSCTVNRTVSQSCVCGACRYVFESVSLKEAVKVAKFNVFTFTIFHLKFLILVHLEAVLVGCI